MYITQIEKIIKSTNSTRGKNTRNEKIILETIQNWDKENVWILLNYILKIIIKTHTNKPKNSI